MAITQFVEDIPKGYSTPDFERKPITVTLQEGEISYGFVTSVPNFLNE